MVCGYAEREDGHLRTLGVAVSLKKSRDQGRILTSTLVWVQGVTSVASEGKTGASGDGLTKVYLVVIVGTMASTLPQKRTSSSSALCARTTGY